MRRYHAIILSVLLLQVLACGQQDGDDEKNVDPTPPPAVAPRSGNAIVASTPLMPMPMTRLLRRLALDFKGTLPNWQHYQELKKSGVDRFADDYLSSSHTTFLLKYLIVSPSVATSAHFEQEDANHNKVQLEGLSDVLCTEIGTPRAHHFMDVPGESLQDGLLSHKNTHQNCFGCHGVAKDLAENFRNFIREGKDIAAAFNVEMPNNKTQPLCQAERMAKIQSRRAKLFPADVRRLSESFRGKKSATTIGGHIRNWIQSEEYRAILPFDRELAMSTGVRHLSVQQLKMLKGSLTGTPFERPIPFVPPTLDFGVWRMDDYLSVTEAALNFARDVIASEKKSPKGNRVLLADFDPGNVSQDAIIANNKRVWLLLTGDERKADDPLWGELTGMWFSAYEKAPAEDRVWQAWNQVVSAVALTPQFLTY